MRELAETLAQELVLVNVWVVEELLARIVLLVVMMVVRMHVWVVAAPQ